MPKFGEWDVNDPASAEGFTVIFNKARDEKRTGGKSDSPSKEDATFRHGATLGKPQSVSCNFFYHLLYFTWFVETPCVNPLFVILSKLNSFCMLFDV